MESGFFQDFSHQLGYNPIQRNYGIAISDIDDDGYFEAFVTGFGHANLVLKWDGNQYINIADAILADPKRGSIGVASADINLDGKEEIYVLNTDAFAGRKQFPDRLFRWEKNKWIDEFSRSENIDMANPTSGRSVIAVDRIGNGQYGFFVANYGGSMRFYEEDAAFRLFEIASILGLSYTTGGRSLVSFPFFGDQMDIFAGNEHGPNFFFKNRGDGTFEEVGALLGIQDPEQHARGVAILDADQNGKLDLVCSNWEGYHRLYVQNQANTFTDQANKKFAYPSKVRTVVIADFDNDGWEEIFFNNIGQANRLFKFQDGDWVPIDPGSALEATGLGTGAAVGDLDRDGKLELIISHGESGMEPLSLHKAYANDFHSIRILPLTRAGAPARGALVRLFTPLHNQVRVIDAGSGYLCQMEPVAHFGLGSNTIIDEVEITWPDGKKYRFKPRSIDTQISVPYPQ